VQLGRLHRAGHGIVAPVDERAIDRARERLAESARGRPAPADLEAALQRARAQVEELAAVAAGLREGLPDQVGEAVRAGVRTEAAPVGRQLAEVRGLAAQTIRRLEQLEADLTAERYARVDDLGLLFDLVISGWRNVNERLLRIERAVGTAGGATVHRLDDKR
jgi:hypothetical protein